MKLTFSDRVALVTGATRGIGRQIADDLERLGAALILTGTNEAEIRRLDEESSASRTYHCVDFRDSDSTAAFLEDAEKHDRIDILVNNAGINRINSIDEARVEDWTDILHVNLEAPFLLTRQIGRGMKERGYGRIVNIASIFGVVSREKRSVYSTTKFGLLGLTVGASNDLARYNVLVNAVSPGFVLTDLTREILSEEERDDLASQVPAGRLAQPSDISSAVVFLCSDLNTYLTGQNVIVDGGFVNV